MRTKLRDGEQIKYIAYLHWIILAEPAVYAAGSIIIYGLSYVLGGTVGALLRYASTMLILMAMFYLTYQIINRRVNIWVVTDKRIIDEWGIVTKNAREIPIDKINDISKSQPVLGQMLGYGSIVIETAADDGGAHINNVADYEYLADALAGTVESYRGKNQSAPDQATDTEDTMACPECGETIKKVARRCRFCSHVLIKDTQQASTAIQSTLSEAKMAGQEDANAGPNDSDVARLSPGEIRPSVGDFRERTR